jgi:hypothetical protein
MKRFVSEALIPLAGTFSTEDLARGEPSLPEGFVWRGEERRIAEVLERAKEVRAEPASGEKYVARHGYRLRMDDDSIWDVYFVRQPLRRGGGRRPTDPRWFLKTVSEKKP